MESYFDYVMDSLENVETLEVIMDRSIHRRPRIFRERSSDFAKYDDIDFFIRYRMSKETVIFLLEKIEHQLEYKDDRNKSVSPINQLLCALRYFATGNVLQAVGDLNGVSVATCSRIIKRVSEAIVSLRDEFIRFPESEEEQSVVKEEFYRIARFPNVLGCIDCTHIKIQSPGGEDAELFRNRKSYMSINVQTISSANLLITDIVSRWPGSTHDSTIYQNSRRYSKFQRGDYGGAFLLGDSGYPLKVKMPILFSAVASDKLVLAKFASCEGNFVEIANQVLSKVPRRNEKVTYYHGHYLIHYIVEDDRLYFCITDKTCQRSRAFLFLNQVRRRVICEGKVGIQLLADEMYRYSEDYNTIVIRDGELDELNRICVKSSEEILGEKLLYVKNTENLNFSVISYVGKRPAEVSIYNNDQEIYLNDPLIGETIQLNKNRKASFKVVVAIILLGLAIYILDYMPFGHVVILAMFVIFVLFK